MIRKFIAAFVIIFFAASTTVFAADEPKVIQMTGDGQAPSNWDQRDSFAKTFARQAARMDALVKLAEYIGGIYVHSDDSKITTRISHDNKTFELLTKHARQVGDAKFSFGDDGILYCEVTMEVVVPADWDTAPKVSQK